MQGLQFPAYLVELNRVTWWKDVGNMNWVLASLLPPEELQQVNVPQLAARVTQKAGLPRFNLR